MFTLLLKLFGWIPVPFIKATDKRAHFVTGALGALLIALISGNLYAAVLGIAFAGIVKEWWYDATHKGHTVDAMDFVATACGGIVGALLVSIL